MTHNTTPRTTTNPQPAPNQPAPGPAPRPPHVLSIAGSDPSGGAGIQADIKSISAHGGYAMAAITALTAQNTQGVQGVHVPAADFLRQQLDSLSADITIDAVKIGMLANAEVMDTVGEWLAETRPPVVVLDPVMVATSGDALVDGDARKSLLRLLHQAHLATPNLAELAVLCGEPEAASWDAALQQGKALAAVHGTAVLVKGGHLEGDQCPDALVGPDGSVEIFAGPRVDTDNTHGTGCSLSAALATLQVQTGSWAESMRRAKDWLTGCLQASGVLDIGHGHGPLNHFHELWALQAPAAGEFTRSLWAQIAPEREAIFALDFIRELASGGLDERHFAYYLAQDAQYLNAYSRVLSRASALAPTEDEQRFWAAGAQNCLVVELALHREWLSRHPVEVARGPVTKHYVDHLSAVAFSGSYAELAAAVLPCYWLYAEVGRVLHAGYLRDRTLADDAGTGAGAHPYGEWLETYADEAFAEATARAVAIVDAAAVRGSALERERMREAFVHSARYEVDFFDAPRRHA
ncbi:bifunctional hydroxymethylpyrimidine kinase/phosphomethylpyrimidine kinase [Arthrobacter sp. STN4]|uniref:bifunctional hydroxymethylpyrimidine kinase/phosphomethylpyrimidine kinase n=1 Tax=Arthrobacter sp. STN4 TaxID=2923276 RepID=UPI00211A0E1F|nr:bifunctional hydroxymethylpyrimidine kinase/phosphomethylpyrimidine kinase [Arthrobacter sp. STN4]